MSKREDSVLVQHIIQAAREALLFARERSRRDLVTDRQFALATVKCIEIIAEAAYQMTEAGRARYPDVPWEKVIGTRHRLVHAYSQIDYDVIWTILQEHLPQMLEQLEYGDQSGF